MQGTSYRYLPISDDAAMDIAGVHSVLDVIGSLDVVVDGGWGIDAKIGRQTREHADLDLVVRERQRADVIHAIARFGAAVDLHWLDDDDVQVLADGSRFHYPMELTAGMIGTRSVRCFTPEVDVLLHWGYPPGAHDHADMDALWDATGVSLPHPFTQAGIIGTAARDARAADAMAMACVHHETAIVAYTPIGLGEAQRSFTVEQFWRAWQERIADPSQWCGVLEADGAVAGTIHLGPLVDEPGVGDLTSLYLAPALWGSGHAARLDTLAFDEARRRYRSLRLNVLQANERAQRFYVRRGWKPDGTEHRFELSGREIVTLHYRIDL